MLFRSFEKQEVWVREAQSLPAIKFVGEKLLSLMPPDIAETLTNTALLKNSGEAPAGETKAAPESGYQNNETKGLDNLIQGTGGDQQPQFGQSSGESTGQ